MAVSADQVRDLVARHALAGAELAERLERASDEQYWNSLCPGLLGQMIDRGACSETPSSSLASSLDEYATRGYCSVSDVFEGAQLDQLNLAVRTVNRAGWPMVFAFLYDPFWALTRTPKFDAFLNAVVGRNYQTSLIFWANHVPALHGASGFSPHKDGRSYGKSTVTCWVPLTPATPDNGCMYVVDTNDATRSLLDTFDSLETLSKRQVSVLMANIRALPIDPGGFLAWRHDVIHWGGRYRCGTQDRLALSWEIISDDYENTDADLHAALRHDRPLPRFDLRLKWICQAFLQFAGREPILGRFVPLANAILHR